MLWRRQYVPTHCTGHYYLGTNVFLQNAVEQENGATVLVVATETRVVARAFPAARPERTAAKVEDAVKRGESSLDVRGEKTGVIELSDVVVSYYCTVVNGKKGCCRNGKICTSGGGGGGGCVTSGYVQCAGENFCCRMYSHPHLPLVSHTHDHGFSLCPSSWWIHLLPR